MYRDKVKFYFILDAETKKLNEASNYQPMENAWNTKFEATNQKVAESKRNDNVSFNKPSLRTNENDRNKTENVVAEEKPSLLQQLFANSGKNDNTFVKATSPLEKVVDAKKAEEDKSLMLKQLLGIISEPVKEVLVFIVRFKAPC